MKIPQEDQVGNKILTQPNINDISGTFWSTFNIDVNTNKGRIRIAPRLLINTSSATQVDMGTPVAFKKVQEGANNNWYLSAGDKIYKGGGVPNTVFVPDTATSTPSMNGGSKPDLEIYNLDLYAAAGGLFKLNSAGTAWSTITSGTGSFGGPLFIYANKLYFGNTFSQIGSYDGSTVIKPNGPPNTNQYALDLNAYQANIISCARPASNKIWIGAYSDEGSRGYMHTWDGSAVQVINSYPIEAMMPMAVTIMNDIPYVMDSNGILRAYNGGYFLEVARLPIELTKFLKNPLGAVTARFIHPNGMITRGDSILMLINNQNADNGGTINENLPSGVWEYTKANGLVHKGSASRWVYGTSTTVADYGQIRLSAVGALADAKSLNTSATTNGDLFIGATYFTDASSTESAVFINDTQNVVQKVGNFVTPKIDSENIRDSWNKIFVKHKKFLDSADKVILKYRTEDPAPTEVFITWTSTTSFTTTTNILTKEGYEVEITQGTGSGQTAHISAISSSNASGSFVYTVTLDDTITGASGTAKVRIQNWTKIGTISDQVTQVSDFTISPISTWIQLKVYAVFTGKNEIEEIILTNESQQFAE